MILYPNGFLGQDYSNTTLEFLPNDSQKTFEKNCITQGEDWYYRNKTITYSFNSNGHRCQEIEDIDFDNYVLFSGCSHTEGTGVELEKTYPYLLAKELNCTYYNLALAASGVDVLEYNLLHWFLTFKKKPKYVFIQWPDHSRFISLYPGYQHILPNGSWCTTEEEKRFFVCGENTGFFNARKYVSFNLIKNIIDVPIATINLSSLAEYDNTSLSWKKMDLARDLSHYGNKSHAKIVEILLQNIKETSTYL